MRKKLRKFMSLFLVLALCLSLFVNVRPVAATIPPLKPGPVRIIYIPHDNFGQLSVPTGEPDNVYRSGTTVSSGPTSYQNDPGSYWSGLSGGGAANVGNNRALFMRLPVPVLEDEFFVNNENFKVTLEFNVENKHNIFGASTTTMTLFTMKKALPEVVSSMSLSGTGVDAVKRQYECDKLVVSSNAVGVSTNVLTFDLTDYYKENKDNPSAWEFIMLPNCNMLSLYNATNANPKDLWPRIVVDTGVEDTRTPLEALSIEDTLYHGDKLPGTSRGASVTWSCITPGQSGRISNNTVVADKTESHVVTLRATVGEEYRDFENVTIVARSANVSAEIVIRGADVDDAKNRPGALTFKGFGLINANSTSELLMDYKAQHPDKYWELMNILFGGPNPLFVHIKMEMGNDNDNSTGAEPATKRFADESANAARSKGFQMAADAKKINPDVKISMLRWGMPRWVEVDESGGTGTTASSAKVREQFYIWYRDTIFDMYARYGYIPDFINPDQNESGFVAAQMKYFYNRMHNETEFPDGWTEEAKEKYRNIRIIGGDENTVPTIAANTIYNDPELRSFINILGYHYFTNGSSSVRRLWEELDFEIWYNEGCAIFGTMEASANSAGGDANNAAGTIGGYQSPLAMIDGFIAGFIENNARKSHYIFQPAIGSFYEGSQYSHKNLLSATDPWSGYVHYDEALYLLSHFTTFSKAGWENEDNTNGIWRMIRNASACWPGNSNEHTWNTGGVPSYMTLASPDKTQFSTIFVNNCPKEMFYKITLDDDMLVPAGAELAVWETKAGSYMQKREVLQKVDGAYWVAVEPFSMVTVTTLVDATPVRLPEDNERTPLDSTATGKGYDPTDNILYADDFEYDEEPDLEIWNSETKTSYMESYIESRGGGARYVVVKNGAFEARDGKLKQLLDRAPTAWHASQPNLIVGDFRWMNYKASIDVDLSKNTAADNAAYGRLTIRQQIGPNNDDNSVNGYSLRVYRSGSWQLLRNGATVASGTVEGSNFYKLELEGREELITGWINGERVVTYIDPVAMYAGRVKLGTNWGFTEFDNLKVETIPGYVPYSTDFIDDGSSKLTYSDFGWYRTSGNGGAAENFGRSLSTKQEDGAFFSFKFTGTGFSILGSNGNYTSASMDIYVDDMETPYISGAAGRNLSGSERHRELYLLKELEYGEHTVKVVITSGTFVMDGVMIHAKEAAGQKNHVVLSESLEIPVALEGADLADILPATVKTEGYENGVKFTDRELPVAWNDANLQDRLWNSVAVNGLAKMGDIEIPVTCNINLVIPSNIVYFVDVGTRETGSDAYDVIKALNPGLLNEVSDKAGDGNNTTASTTWGSAAGPNGAPIVTASSTASNMYTSFIYAPENNSGSSFYYDFTISEPGVYYLAMGFYMPFYWGPRTLRVTASGTALAAPKVLINSLSVPTTPQAIKGMFIEVQQAGSVRLFFERLTGDAAVVSWIAIHGQEAVATPTASVEPGTYDHPLTVELSSATEGASIYYTTDGSMPSVADTVYTSLYTGPITINTDTTLKAIAVKEGMADSEVAEFNYQIVNAPPTVTLTADALVAPDTDFTVEVKLEGSINDIFAEDITISYDEELFDFVEVVSEEGVMIANEPAVVDGSIRIIAANEGGISGNKAILTVKFHAKNIPSSESGEITVTRAQLGSPMPLPTGTVFTAVGGSTSVAIRKPPVPVTGIEIDQGDSLSLMVGETVELTATIEPSDADDKTITWTSDSPAATVDQNGKVTAVEVGTAVITATAGGVSDSIIITVTPLFIPATGITLDASEVSLAVGADITLTATVTPADSTSALVWSSNNTAVATVDENGKVTAVSQGTAVITVASQDDPAVKETCTVTVYVAGDVNDDGIVDVDDLAIAAYYYRAKAGDSNWNEARVADINGDGKIDILDLAAIAMRIQ